nr:hypothetical protein [Tanacetum cinerariifolium]
MTLTFADTHNMVAYLSKSDASEGFDQIIDFINGSYIAYALTVNLTIYVSCIKQFWRTVAVKSSNDVTRLQALVDKKRVVVTEAAIKDALHLDDAEGVDCLPNEEIFTELARMGYEKPTTKLTFYKAFFSSQWKFLIHIILQSMSAKRTSWNKFSSAMASAMICLSTGRKFNFSMYIFESLVRNVDSSTKFYMYPRFINLIIQNQLGDLSTYFTKYISPALTQKVFANMRRVRKGCSGVEMLLFEGMIAARELENQVNAEEHGAEEEQGNGNNAAEEPVTAVDDAISQSTQSPTPLTPLPQQPQDIPLKSQRIESSADTIMEDMSNQGRMTEESYKDEGAKVVNEEEETEEVRDNAVDAKVEGKHADIYHIDMDHATKVLSMQEDEPEIQEAVEVVTTAKLITEVIAAVSETISVVAVVQANVPAAPVNAAAVMTTPAPVKVVVPATRRRRGVIIRDPEEESSTNTPAETKSKDKGKGILVEEPKPIKKKQQVKMDEAFARKLQEEFNQDIDWETAIDHVKQRAKEEPFIQRYQHLEIEPDEDDDVFTEATPLTRKVPVVDYQIIHVDNKPRYKIIHLETLWNIVKERFSTSKPNNFSNEYLLSALKTIFRRPDGQDNVWKDQRSAHGQALVKSWKLLTSCGVHIISFTTTQIILLVERRYPLSKFTLEQMINVVRLQVEEQSEMSLELIRFTRQ